MGQEESTPIADVEEIPGFERRERKGKDEHPTGRDKKPKKKKKKENLQEDRFLRHVEVKDHITPIYDERQKKKFVEADEHVEGALDINQLLDKIVPREESEDETLRPPSVSEVESSESESDWEDRGTYHRDAKKKERKRDITDPRAHPVAVEGTSPLHVHGRRLAGCCFLFLFLLFLLFSLLLLAWWPAANRLDLYFLSLSSLCRLPACLPPRRCCSGEGFLLEGGRSSLFISLVFTTAARERLRRQRSSLYPYPFKDACWPLTACCTPDGLSD
eukprot:GHVU01024080.1.p1 GENE.GHVU01024080.1~~GHVU01024080.1.p1  ORF type:complete len:274 (+),score=55.53 GHVU01024080.1:367-1188(+)